MSNNLVNQSTKAISTNELQVNWACFGCRELRSNGPIFYRFRLMLKCKSKSEYGGAGVEWGNGSVTVT